MARNSEKAMTALARWRQSKLAEDGLDKKNERRPYLASHCDNLKDAEKWRLQIIREISKKVSQIQNAGLGEFRIRDLNDEINKLLREKRHWENRIIDLGGRDMRRRSRMLDKEGKEVPGSYGYKYFGAARDLPGVRELFETDAPPAPKKTRGELMKDVDAQYYGFMDDDDGFLVPVELAAEKKAIAKAMRKWKNKNESGDSKELEDDEDETIDDENVYKAVPEADEDLLEEAMQAGRESRFVSHVPIPSQKDIEEALLRRKKQELLNSLALDDDHIDEVSLSKPDPMLKDEQKNDD